MYVLAVDPGKKAGWAIYHDGTLLASGAMQHSDDVLEVASFLDGRTFDVLVIEDQFFLRNAKGFKTLVYRRAIWEILARERKKQVVLVPPTRWQARYKGLDWQVVASSLAGHALASRDEAAAICIGDWYVFSQKGERHGT